jgi:hypothetical protein
LASACRLVQRGGKIVVLSRAAGPLGPNVQRLRDAGDPKKGLTALRGHESEVDSVAARQLAQAANWADIYLLSALGADVSEDLSLFPLDRPEEARRLVASTGSCLVVSHAELTRCAVADEDGEPIGAADA